MANRFLYQGVVAESSEMDFSSLLSDETSPKRGERVAGVNLGVWEDRSDLGCCRFRAGGGMYAWPDENIEINVMHVAPKMLKRDVDTILGFSLWFRKEIAIVGK